MGLPWVGGYLASLWNGIGRRGLRAAARFAEAAAAGDLSALGDLTTADASIELGATTLTARAFVERLAGGRIAVESPVSAGWTTSFRFAFDGKNAAAGLARFEFEPGSGRIHRARFFTA
jgi:hypothetical protein